MARPGPPVSAGPGGRGGRREGAPPPRAAAHPLIGPVHSPSATPPAPASGTPAAPARHLHICARAADWPGLGGAAVTAAAPAAAPAASGDPGGRMPLSAPLPSRRGPTAGGGRREAESPPCSNMAPPRRRPNRRCGYSSSPGRPRGGEVLGPGALWPERGAVQWPGLPSPPSRGRHVRPRPRGGLSLPAAPPPRQSRQARPGRALTSGGVAAEVTHALCISPPARDRRGTTRLFKRPWFRTHVLLSCRDPDDTACAVKSGARRVPRR